MVPALPILAFKDHVDVLKLGGLEKAAVQNLVKLRADVRNVFAAGAAIYGVVRGPITHNGLASELLLDGAGPDPPSAAFKLKMKNKQSTCLWTAKRALGDYVNAAQSLRKSMNSDNLMLQKACRMFELAMEELAKQIPDAAFTEAKRDLEKSFMATYLDDALVQKADQCVSISISPNPGKQLCRRRPVFTSCKAGPSECQTV